MSKSLERALFHRCNIFHLKEETQNELYGVKQSVRHTYPSEPDLVDVKSYWDMSNQQVSDTRDARPDRTIQESFTVVFLPSEDIRLNDRVLFEGNYYILGIPKKLKSPRKEYAWEVEARRVDKL